MVDDEKVTAEENVAPQAEEAKEAWADLGREAARVAVNGGVVAADAVSKGADWLAGKLRAYQK